MVVNQVRELTLPADSPWAEVRASLEARDSTLDFSRRGSNRFLQEYAAMVPFMRPVLQGSDRAVRAAREQPLRVATAMGAITALSVYNRTLWNDGRTCRRGR